MQLSELGDRICILGPSNSGKSTLAVAIGQKLGMPVVHLDQLQHIPNTNWEQRPPHEFKALHDEEITRDRWVIDGNYSRLMPQRIARATGVIRLGASTPKSLYRYFRRTLFEGKRHGTLEGGADSIKWNMIHHIAVVIPKNHKRNQAIFDSIDLPKIDIHTMRDLSRYYSMWDLDVS